MKINDIKIIVEIAKCRSVSLAANDLGVCQSSLSRTLKRVEENLGVRLFNRLGSSLILTEEGRVYENHFRNILMELSEAKNDIFKLHEEFKETVKISLHVYYARTLLPKLEYCLKDNTSLNVEYVLQGTSKGYDEVLRGDVDMAIVADIKSFPDIIKVNLWKEYVGVFSSDGKPKDDILYNPDMPLAKKLLRVIEYKKVQEISDYDIICSLLRVSDKMGILPELFANEQNKLKVVQKFSDTNISLIYHAGRSKTKAFTKCLNLIKKICKEFNNS